MASIQIAKDRLSATLHIEGGEALDLAQIRTLLIQSNVHSGLCRDVILAAMVPEAGVRDLVVALAEGQNHAQSAPITVIEGIGPLPAKVLAGALVAMRPPLSDTLVAKGVDGKPISNANALSFASGLLSSDDTGQIFTRWSGILVSDAKLGLRVDLPGGIPVTMIEKPVVTVATDGSAATIGLPGGAIATPASLVAAMTAAGVVCGHDRKAILEASVPELTPRTIVLAVAEPAVNGGEDVVERIIETDDSPSAVDQHHHMDFHRIHWIKEVTAGAELIRLHRGQPPQAGRSVTGAPIPGGESTPIELGRFVGSGTRIKPDDPLVIVATLTGACAFDAAGVVSVCGNVLIPANLDHHFGDIETSLPVEVRGDVIAGFTLVSAAEAKVGGAIEDARVVIHGDLTVGSGIMPGKQRVVVHGHLEARHITGRPVRAASLDIALSIIDSEVIAGTDLTCGTLNSSRAIVGHSVICDVCGDASEARTVIELGGEPFLVALAHEAVAERQRSQGVEKNLRDRLVILHHHLHEMVSHSSLEEAGPISEEIGEYEQRLAIVTSTIERAEKIITRHQTSRLRSEKALEGVFLEVKRCIYAGSEVVIGTKTHRVAATIKGPLKFHLVEGEIVGE